MDSRPAITNFLDAAGVRLFVVNQNQSNRTLQSRKQLTSGVLATSSLERVAQALRDTAHA